MILDILKQGSSHSSVHSSVIDHIKLVDELKKKEFLSSLRLIMILYFSNVNQVKKANYHTYKLNNILIGLHSERGLSPLKLKMVFVVKVKSLFCVGNS